MMKKLTPEEEHEADRLFAQWREAANAVAEARDRYGDGSPEYGNAAKVEGEIWGRYKQLRPASEKSWAK